MESNLEQETKHYNKEFYGEQEDLSYNSAKILVPMINEIFHPKSVIDIGCGVGFWLKVWKEEIGITDILGVEGPYVTAEMFKTDSQLLKIADLKLPLQISRRYDMVTTFEVAEHIEEQSADVFINNLVKLSDVVVFSAAIIGQKGTYHVNEQMPEYWAEKFLKHDYIPVDYLRPHIWKNNKIAYWYRQNILFFMKKETAALYPVLQEAVKSTRPDYLLRIHPEKYFAYVDELNKITPITGYIHQKLYLLKKRIFK